MNGYRELFEYKSIPPASDHEYIKEGVTWMMSKVAVLAAETL